MTQTESPSEPNEVEQWRREREQTELGDHPHLNGITRGTILEYDDWQWVLVTEIDEGHEPMKVGFIPLNNITDRYTEKLEAAWGCWEHYEKVEQFRGGGHEYWTDAEYILHDDTWSVRGPIHPDERDTGAEEA